jgi:hypothetical protein
MDSSNATNGSASFVDASLSPAEQLKARHAANTPDHHHVEVEEVVDEDDLDHPPPVAQPGSSGAQSSGILDRGASAGASQSARGKQRPAVPLNMDSEEMFPSLGPSKPASAVPAQMWSRKPAVSAAASPLTSSNGVSASAKGKGPRLPNQSATESPTKPMSSTISLPGRSTEKIVFAPGQITPRDKLKRPIPDILRDINKKFKVRVEMKEGTDRYVAFEGTGSQDAVRFALKEVAKQIGSRVSLFGLMILNRIN